MLLLLLLPFALAEDALGCTAFGPVLLAGEQGSIHGPEWTVEVREGAATIRHRQDAVWSGPFTSLAFRPVTVPPVHGTTIGAVTPRESTVLELSRIVEAQMWAARLPPSCPWGTGSTLLLPPWPDPIPVPSGATVAWNSGVEAFVVSATSRVWYRAVAATPDMAADLSQALAPHTNRAVFWKNRAALAVVSTVPIAGDPVAPASASRLGWHPFLEGASSVERLVDAGPPVLAAGREMVAALNERRLAAGLRAVVWDDKLAWAAMAHCVYTDWVDANLHAYHGHDEDPATPVFVGKNPNERGGAWEVVARAQGHAPSEAVDGWLATPFHRKGPMHPSAVRAGACATPGGAHVMEIDVDRSVPSGPFVYPPDLASDVPLSFSGREDPDPVPLATYPHKELPMGFTLSAWLPLATIESRVTESWIRSGKKKVAHYVVDTDLRNPDGGVVLHLIAKAPFAPRTRYEWGIELDGPSQRVEGSFTTGAAPFATDDTGPYAAWMESENDRRQREGLPPLRHCAALDAIAESYRVRHQWPHELAFPGHATLYCSGTSAAGPPSVRNENAVGAPLTLVGFAGDARETCVVATVDPLQPWPEAAP